MKKCIFFIGVFFIFNGCAQNTAFLGPSYTIVKTGNIYQAGLTYKANKLVEKETGEDLSSHVSKYFHRKKEKKIIREDLIKLIKARIENTRTKLFLDN